MVATLPKEGRTAVPADPWMLYRDNPALTWWANQVLQALRLALSVWYFPAAGAWWRWCQAWAEGPAHAERMGPRPPAVDPPRPAPAPMPAQNRAELEELREAWREYEETRGDWSKSR
jgi:hypothetical protein